MLRVSEQVEELNKKIEEFRVGLVKKYGEKVFDVTIAETNETKVINEAEYESADKSLFSGASARLEIIDKDKLQEFISEFDELLRTEEEVPFDPVDLNELGNEVRISPQDLFFLKKILT